VPGRIFLTKLKELSLLFVEDQAEERDIFSILIEPLIHKLYTASDGVEGLESYKQNRPDVIITDLNMPVMGGIEFCKEIKSINPECFVIALTAYNESHFMIDAINAGFDAFLLKPIHKKPILSKLKEAYEKIKKAKDLQLKDQMLLQRSKQVALGEVTLIIAHQWKQPLNALNAVIQNIEQINTKSIKNRDIKAYIKQANELIAEISQTIDDFREFFKQNKTSQILELEKTVTQILGMVSPLYTKEKIAVSLYKNSAEIYGPPSELGQCILNLLQNSKDAILERNPTDRWIKLRICKHDNKVCLCVNDSGGGVKEEYLSKIFDPYFTTKNDGLGIGLYMVKTIIENHFGGSVIAENKKHGLHIRMEFPLP